MVWAMTLLLLLALQAQADTIMDADGVLTLAAETTRFLAPVTPSACETVPRLVVARGRCLGLFSFKRGHGNGADESTDSPILEIDPSGRWIASGSLKNSAYTLAATQNGFISFQWRIDRGGALVATHDGTAWNSDGARPDGLNFIYAACEWKRDLYAGGAAGC